MGRLTGYLSTYSIMGDVLFSASFTAHPASPILTRWKGLVSVRWGLADAEYGGLASLDDGGDGLLFAIRLAHWRSKFE